MFQNWDNKQAYSFYNWDDGVYRNFMMELMYSLEPVKYGKDEIITNELDEVNEIIFFIKGSHDIGYELNC